MPDERIAGREPGGPALLRLARRDREAARARLRALADAQQAETACGVAPGARAEFLMLLDHPERVVPLLPEAELVHTIRAGGMEDAAWLMELATPEQRIACFDLDCWQGEVLDVQSAREWLDVLIEAGRETLARGLEEMDLELLLLALRGEVEVSIQGKEDPPPEGAFTLDGVVYFRLAADASPARVHAIVSAARAEAPALYWRIAHGLIFELPAECEEYALRWRSRRLNDLGFPDHEDAMELYRPLAPERVEDFGREEYDSRSVVRSYDLPQLGSTLLGEALAGLEPRRVGEAVGQVLSVANWIAIADGLKLSEPDSIPCALRKAVRGIDRGLRELVSRRGQPPAEVVARTRARDLFRVGATLDPELRARPAAGDSGETDP